MHTSSLRPIADLVEGCLEQMSPPHAHQSWMTGIPDLDQLTGGLQAGKLWAVTGRPGAGKSVLTLGMARNVAIGNGGRAVVLTQRDTPEQQARRVLSAEARVPLIHLRDGHLTEDDRSRVEAAMTRLHGADLLIAQASDPVLAALALEGSDAGPSPHLIVVDAVNVAYPRIGELRELGQLAESLRCAVVAVLAHVPSRPVQASDEAATLGADVVLRLDDWSASERRGGEADLVVTYHRDGPTAKIDLLNQNMYARFIPDDRRI